MLCSDCVSLTVGCTLMLLMIQNVVVAAVTKPLAEIQLISAKSGEGGANTDSDGFDDLDWTVWNRITL